MTLIDSNILIDILGGDPVWSEPSVRRLSDCARRGPIAINDIVYAELAAGFASQAQSRRRNRDHAAEDRADVEAALFLAGQVFRRYRAGGGTRPNVLADFFIGAQASAEGWPILTRDERRYRAYFPDVALVGDAN